MGADGDIGQAGGIGKVPLGKTGQANGTAKVVLLNVGQFGGNGTEPFG